MIRVFTRQIEKLGSEEGQALVFVAMVGLVIFLFFAMSMNIAEILNAKIKSQNAADAAALSGAAWEARALNLVSGFNANMLNAWFKLFYDLLISTGAFTICVGICSSMGPTECGVCLAWLLAIFVATVVRDFGLVPFNDADYQEHILAAIDEGLLKRELTAKFAGQDLVDLNHMFKQNTSPGAKDAGATNFDFTGTTLFVHEEGGVILEGVLEPATWCELLTSLLYHMLNNGVITLAEWDAQVVPLLQQLYDSTPGSCICCAPGSDWYSGWNDGWKPLMLRTRVTPPGGPQPTEHCLGAYNQAPCNPGFLLPVTVGLYRDREPPVILGDTSKGPGTCDVTTPGKTRFPCPSARRYNFASAMPYSQNVSFFYDRAVQAVDSPYPIPVIPTVMDWEPRLVPIEPYPYVDDSGDWKDQWNDRGWEPWPNNPEDLPEDQSPFAGWKAFCGKDSGEEDCVDGSLLFQILNKFGDNDENMLWENSLSLAADRHYFLY